MESYSIADGLVGLKKRLTDALERIAAFEEGARFESDELFPTAFMGKHTQFESFEEFYEQGPWTGEFNEGQGFDEMLDGVSPDEVDHYVAETTRFSSWELMQTRAAEDHILDSLQSN